jgi:hypothetical protein
MARYRWLVPFIIIFIGLFLLYSSTLTGSKSPLMNPRLGEHIRLGALNSEQFPPQYTTPSPIQFPSIALSFLLVPPLPLIHLWLLAQVYRHAYQPGERFKPYILAGIITIPITLLELVGIFIWIWIVHEHLFPTTAKLAPAVGMLWLIIEILSVLCGVIGAVYISRKRGFSGQFQRSMVRSTIEVSLLATLGIAGGVAAWYLIIAGIFGFIIYRFVLERHLTHHKALLTGTLLDRLVLDQMSVTSCAILIAFFAIAYLSSGFRVLGSSDVGTIFFALFSLLIVAGAGGGVSSWWPLKAYGRVSAFYGKKKTIAEDDQSLYQNPSWLHTMTVYTGLWVFLTGVAWYFMTTLLTMSYPL